MVGSLAAHREILLRLRARAPPCYGFSGAWRREHLLTHRCRQQSPERTTYLAWTTPQREHPPTTFRRAPTDTSRRGNGPAAFPGGNSRVPRARLRSVPTLVDGASGWESALPARLDPGSGAGGLRTKKKYKHKHHHY